MAILTRLELEVKEGENESKVRDTVDLGRSEREEGSLKSCRRGWTVEKRERNGRERKTWRKR